LVRAQEEEHRLRKVLQKCKAFLYLGGYNIGTTHLHFFFYFLLVIFISAENITMEKFIQNAGKEVAKYRSVKMPTIIGIKPKTGKLMKRQEWF